ncbi:hypothetical protein BJ944DRAFT_243553 [Cunninghamella echinulata]|nr:hypothetical protein BJ944DRAFT_243553 [Cunninghamella echinulata]
MTSIKGIGFTEEIAASILALQKDGTITWDEFIENMESLIISSYSNEDKFGYKALWRERFIKVAKMLNIRVRADNKQYWKKIESKLCRQRTESDNSPGKNPTSTNSSKTTSLKSYSSSSSSSHNYILSNEDIESIKKRYASIDQNKKWKLSTGTVVEDVMEKVAIECKYEHPVHSLILDIKDSVWNDYFSTIELDEITNHNRKSLSSLPSTLVDYLNTYDNNNLSAKEIYKYACNHSFDPIDEYDKKWIQQTIVTAVDIFMFNDVINTNCFSEADYLHRIWRFIYMLFNDNYVDAIFGEKTSDSISKRKNETPQLERIDKRKSKAMDSGMDILFKYGFLELGCVEAGIGQISTYDNKYMNDGMIKLPKALRDIMVSLVEYNGDNINNFVTVGFILLGLEMELVIMDVPEGHSICRITRSPVFTFPFCINSFGADIIPILEITWKAKKLMQDTISLINKKKRKASEMTTKNTKPTLLSSFNTSSL